jgi:hypothetical protein
MREDTYARKFTFQSFEGKRKGRLWRIGAIAWFNLIYQWQRSRALKILIFFIMFILIMSNLFLFTSGLELSDTKNANDVLDEHLWGTIRKFARFHVLITSVSETDPVHDTGYSIFMIIGLIMVGAGLVSDDMRYKVSEIYDSKISRNEYILGKYGTLILFGNLLFTLPCFLEWVLVIIGISGVNILEAIPTLLGVILFSEILICVLSSFILTFSSLTQKRLYSGLFSFAFFLTISNLIPTLVSPADTFSPILYIDFFTVLSIFSFMINGETRVIYYGNCILTLDLTGWAGLLVLPMIVFYILSSFIVCYYQLIWRHLFSLRRLLNIGN